MPDFGASGTQELKRKIAEIERRVSEIEKLTKRLKIEGDQVLVKVSG